MMLLAEENSKFMASKTKGQYERPRTQKVTGLEARAEDRIPRQ